MGRGAIRTVSVMIIVITIPFYLCGIGFWLFLPDKAAPTATPTQIPQIIEQTNTPINPFDLVTQVQGTVTNTPINPFDLITQAAVTNTPFTFPTFIPTATREFEPVVFTFTPPPPTMTHTPVPQPTATATTPPQPTIPIEPSATSQILLPPTDTPSP